MKYELEGYVIVPPVSSWDKTHEHKIIPEMSYSTFHVTAAGSWALHCQVSIIHLDFSEKVQAWHDRGYRLKKAKLTINMGEE
jgi:hypothetical protein